MEHLDVYFSNRLAKLYEQLKVNLYGRPTKPFKRRIVVVYGPAMKNWLTYRMAQDPDLGIATGIEFLYLNQAFGILLQLFDPAQPRFPNQMELALGIELEIRKALAYEDQDAWQPLVNYLKGEGKKRDKRITSLSMHLSTLFLNYGRFGQNKVSEWESGEVEDWQAKIWQALYSQKTGWSSISRCLANDLRPLPNCEIHFFSISFISRPEYAFICRLPSYAETFYYLLSPCALFWSDIRTDREALWLQKKWEKKLGADAAQLAELEDYLSDRNPLLANFGKLGREMARQIEESSARTHACYLLPSHAMELNEEALHEDLHFYPSVGPLTLLHAVQADLLTLRNPEGHPSLDFIDNGSIQLHSAPTKRREVQAVYHAILTLMDKDATLAPCDVVVMAPDIVEYRPYIEGCFGQNESTLDFQILDLGLQVHNEIIQAFLHLLDLSESRYEASKVLQLFEHPAFQRCHSLSMKDCHLLRQWTERLMVQWGSDNQHRAELLLKGHCQKAYPQEGEMGTWKQGFERLLKGLVSIEENLPELEFSQSELVEKWLSGVHALKEDLAPLAEEIEMSMEEWSYYFKSLLEAHLKPDFRSSDSQENYLELQDLFDQLALSAKPFRNQKFSSSSVKMHLRALFQKGGKIYREAHLQSIRFCSLMPLRSIPARAVVIMGMQEGAFPRSPVLSSLDRLASCSDYCPSATDFDRYLFMEALQSAEDYFILSYVNYSKEEGKELAPSIIVQELFAYFDKHYTLEGQAVSLKSTRNHPFDCFDNNYFIKNAVIKNYSHFDFECARSLCEKNKIPSHALFADFPPPSTSPPSVNSSTIDIKDLRACASHPIRFFLGRRHEIYLKTVEDRKPLKEQALALSSLDRFLIKKKSLKDSFEKTMQWAEQEGKLPFGLFKEVACQRLTNEMLAWQKILPDEVFSIEFSSACKAPAWKGERLWMPPLECEGAKIVGSIPYASKKGLLLTNKGEFADLWKAWPDFLLFHSAASHFQMDKRIIALQGGQTKEASFSDPLPLLKEFLSYFFFCLEALSPLHPDWLPYILKKNEAGLQNAMQSLFKPSFGGYQSSELKWILNKGRLPSAASIIENWHDLTCRLTGELIEKL